MELGGTKPVGAAPSLEQHCPRCRVLLRADSRFCHRCGAQSQRTTSVDATRGARSSLSALKTVDSTLRPVALLYVSMLGICGLLSLTEWSARADLAATALSAAIVVAFCYQDQRRVFPLLRWRGWDPGMTRTTLVAAFITFPLGIGYFELAKHLGIEVLSPQEVQPYFNMPVVLVLACVVAPIVEELAFRGYMLTRLEEVLSPTEAMVIQAALFSVLHLAPAVFISHFGLGLAFGLVTRRTGSLYPAMALHAAWNAIAVAF